MRNHSIRSLAFVFLLLCASLAQADNWTKKWAVGNAPELRVRLGDISVVFEPGADGEISAELKTRNIPIGDKGLRVIEHQTGDAVDLEVPDPAHGFLSTWRAYTAELRVRVPHGISIDSRAGDGSVHLSGISGKMRIETGDGSIQADDLTGTLAAFTGDGSLHANGRFESVEVRTQDGSVNLKAEEGSHLARGWRIQCGDGSVHLSVPRTLAANLEVRTGDGSIHADLPVSIDRESDKHELSGKLNGGGPTLEIRTGDGSGSLGP